MGTRTLADKYRDNTRRRLFFFGPTNCDYPGCSITATDMHEIIARGVTAQNPEARFYSYSPEVCSALCREHHKIAHTPAVRDTLLRVNIRRYGRERVQSVVDLINDAMNTELNLELPDG